MSNTELAAELRIISSHLIAQMDDIAHTRSRLEELKKTRLANRLDTVAGKLYDTVNAIDAELRKLSE